MPKIKAEKRLNFRKQVSEPWLLRVIEKVSVAHNETPLKSCYRLMRNGGKDFLKNDKNKENE